MLKHPLLKKVKNPRLKNVKKASYINYKILKNLTYRDSNILVPLFKTLVRPILEYGNSVWANGLKKYKTLVENVQRKLRNT